MPFDFVSYKNVRSKLQTSLNMQKKLLPSSNVLNTLCHVITFYCADADNKIQPKESSHYIDYTIGWTVHSPNSRSDESSRWLCGPLLSMRTEPFPGAKAARALS